MNPQSKRHCMVRNLLALSAALLVLPGGPALAQDTGTLDKGKVVEQPKPYSPYVDQHFPQRVLFGDMHHHTSLSVDSGLIGNTNGPDVSFRLARGEVVTSNSGQPVKLVRPLDFLVVTDHAEYLGIAKLLAEADPTLLATDIGKEWYAHMQGSPEDAWAAVVDMQKTSFPAYRDSITPRSNVPSGTTSLTLPRNTTSPAPSRLSTATNGQRSALGKTARARQAPTCTGA